MGGSEAPERAPKKGLPSTRGFLLVLGSFLVGGLALGLFQDRPEYRENRLAADLPAPRPQAAGERDWRALELGEPRVGSREGAGVLLRGLAVRRGPEGDVYVLDWRGEGVKRFTPALEKSGRFARPAEDAEGKLHPTTDVATAADGSVWVLYSDFARVDVFTAEGEPARQLELDVRPQRVAPLPDGRFALLVLYGHARHLLEVRSPDGEVLHRFGKILEADVQSPLLLDGNLAVTEDGSLVYAPLYLGLLASYSPEGELRYLVRTVDGEDGPLPKILVHPNGWRKVEPGTPWQSLGINEEAGRLYVLSERDSGLEDRRIIDVYQSADGSYLESYRLPNNPNSAILGSDWLYTVRREDLTAWPRTAGKPSGAPEGATTQAGGL